MGIRRDDDLLTLFAETDECMVSAVNDAGGVEQSGEYP
jgi:hypothetical protein